MCEKIEVFEQLLYLLYFYKLYIFIYLLYIIIYNAVKILIFHGFVNTKS